MPDLRKAIRAGQGSGAGRYIKVKTLEELEQPDLHTWIKNAGRVGGWTWDVPSG